ncbi:2-polyprenyl-6-methoxyphenol hydroxylase-like FAD-dependent oxidoreductase [Streptomyces sp. V1I6]|nr:2-polyprenyl-6-methoxyphenol hydroxylase-like FAD-dependent oxidoreductase [Streptomyces sp. V1I6]
MTVDQAAGPLDTMRAVGVEEDAGGPVRVTYRDDEGDHLLRADAVLGCDGANSVTRDAIGAVWEDLRFEERWTVIDVHTSLPVRSWEGVDQVCAPNRPATFMRIGEDRYRWEFRLLDASELDHERLRATSRTPPAGHPCCTPHETPSLPDGPSRERC